VRRLHKVRTWEATRLDERGSTLIEVLVAALVLTTGVIAAAQLVSIATLSNVSARTTTTAVILAGQKAEQLRALAGAMLLPSPPASLKRPTSMYTLPRRKLRSSRIASGTLPLMRCSAVRASRGWSFWK
jgi:Tfp pilus assembly protein PilV